MKPLVPHSIFEQLVADLTPRYGSGEARSIARIVFEDAFGTRQPAGKILSAEEEPRFVAIRQRLLHGEPVQYVLEEADFFGLKFKVSPAVLIPRQETEELVAWVLEWLKQLDVAVPKLLDIGLGSGGVGVSIRARRPAVQLFGLEKSPEALALATENARRLLGDGNFSFGAGDILDQEDWEPFPLLDVIVSNPPYIPRKEETLVPEHVRQYEPAMALFVDDADPLLFYRAIAAFALQRLRPGGALFFECNEFNAPQVAELLQQAGFARVELRQDLAGADRMVKSIRP